MSRLGRDGQFGPGEVVVENVRAREDGSFEIVFSSNRPTWGRGEAAFGAQDVYISRSWWLTGAWPAPLDRPRTANIARCVGRPDLANYPRFHDPSSRRHAHPPLLGKPIRFRSPAMPDLLWLHEQR